MKKGYVKAYIKILLVVLVLVAMFYGILYFFKREYNKEQFETVKTNMLLIQSKTQQVAEKVKMKEKDATYIGNKIEELKDNEEIKKLQEKGIINLEEKDSKYYVLEKIHLEELQLSTIELNEGYYVIEYNSSEVIYTNGIQNENGDILYKLSDIEK